MEYKNTSLLIYSTLVSRKTDLLLLFSNRYDLLIHFQEEENSNKYSTNIRITVKSVGFNRLYKHIKHVSNNKCCYYRNVFPVNTFNEISFMYRSILKIFEDFTS